MEWKRQFDLLSFFAIVDDDRIIVARWNQCFAVEREIHRIDAIFIHREWFGHIELLHSILSKFDFWSHLEGFELEWTTGWWANERFYSSSKIHKNKHDRHWSDRREQDPHLEWTKFMLPFDLTLLMPDWFDRTSWESIRREWLSCYLKHNIRYLCVSFSLSLLILFNHTHTSTARKSYNKDHRSWWYSFELVKRVTSDLDCSPYTTNFILCYRVIIKNEKYGQTDELFKKTSRFYFIKNQKT